MDAFIEQAVHQLTEKGLDDDLFHQIEDLIEHVSPQITQVFNSPDQARVTILPLGFLTLGTSKMRSNNRA